MQVAVTTLMVLMDLLGFIMKDTEMTFSGKFKRTGDSPTDDLYREMEFVTHLENNGYGYIVEPFLTDTTPSEN